MSKNNILGKVAVAVLFGAAAVLGGVAGCSTKKGSGTFTGTAKGMGGDVTVTLTLEDGKITDVKAEGPNETPTIGGPVLESLPKVMLEANSVNVDTVSGATVTSTAIIEAATQALSKAGLKPEDLASVEVSQENVEVTYSKPGTYTGTANGYNGPINLKVTFGEDGIEDIDYSDNKETAHIGTPAFDYLVEDAKEANGSGIDSVSGATFTSAGFKDALTDAAEQAGASDLDGFKSNTVKHEAQDPVEETYDVVVLGAGGAGMAAAVQSAENGNSVVVVEENAEIGGNTTASGGQYQSVQKYLVWDPENPDATTGEYKGVTYDKVKEAGGNIEVLQTIENWNEDEFDPDYFKDHEFVAGDIKTLSQAGVHSEYLQTLKDLKKEIKAYLDWAEPKMAAGEAETDLPLFSTVNLHIFQTYYGGLRPNKDQTSWVYGDYDLVSQFINGGQDLKGWLEDQGALFDNSIQPTIVGALWNRENDFMGSDLDGDGKPDPDGNNTKGKTVFNTYFAPLRNTLTKTVSNASDNKIMLRTTAKSLIVEDGKVTGVKAEMYDGTEVTLHANKGVVIATGGYAANIDRVMETNDYWKDGAITEKTQTTNRSSLQGDGIDMGEEAGAGVTGMGYTQMMPISWVDNGDLAFGGGDYAIYVNPTTGKRYVNETGERDVLSLGEFNNGVTYNGSNGTVIEIANASHSIPGPYPYGTPGSDTFDEDVENRQYTRTVDELGDLFKELGFEADGDTVRKTIEEYDKALMEGTNTELDPEKTGFTALIGNCEKDEQGNYKEDTYTLDGVKLKVRLLAPSTHHTMGGLTVDTERHVLDKDGKKIEGLYAAGEVTGGIHGGNRLGGNAIVEILVSGRTAANAISADNK
jgi:urocanate reductase